MLDGDRELFGFDQRQWIDVFSETSILVNWKYFSYRLPALVALININYLPSCVHASGLVWVYDISDKRFLLRIHLVHFCACLKLTVFDTKWQPINFRIRNVLHTAPYWLDQDEIERNFLKQTLLRGNEIKKIASVQLTKATEWLVVLPVGKRKKKKKTTK